MEVVMKYQIGLVVAALGFSGTTAAHGGDTKLIYGCVNNSTQVARAMCTGTYFTVQGDTLSVQSQKTPAQVGLNSGIQTALQNAIKSYPAGSGIAMVILDSNRCFSPPDLRVGGRATKLRPIINTLEDNISGSDPFAGTCT